MKEGVAAVMREIEVAAVNNKRARLFFKIYKTVYVKICFLAGKTFSAGFERELALAGEFQLSIDVA